MNPEFSELRGLIQEEKQLINKLKKEDNEKNLKTLSSQLQKTNSSILDVLDSLQISQKLPTSIVQQPVHYTQETKGYQRPTPTKLQLEEEDFSKKTLKRIRQKDKQIEISKVKKPSKYIQTANKFFSDISSNMLGKNRFRNLRRNLIRANLPYLPKSYVSVILLTTVLAFIIGFFLFIFFIFFSISFSSPFITLIKADFLMRMAKVSWLLVVPPLGSFLLLYLYPSMERKSVENKMDKELPFVAIHLSAISGSMVEPSRMFNILIATHEYPTIEKEFIKILNKINIYGYDLVNALRDSASNCASKRLAELFNGLATTITSGGDLQVFFEKRSQSLLFEYRLAREKYTRSAETFMDIYISVVIAAPMIFMLLFIIIKVGLGGISLSTGTITFLMILGVSLINIVFLSFLYLKGQSE